MWSATAERVRPNASRQAPILLTIGLHAAANEKSRIAGTMARAEVRTRARARGEAGRGAAGSRARGDADGAVMVDGASYKAAVLG